VSELRLHRSLYAGAAIDSALGLYADHAKIARAEDGEHVVLTISSDRPGRADRVARELGNYALGLTIQARKDDSAAPKAAPPTKEVAR
jgi:hypothetical protein